ncbi:MAG: DUF2156 domain-containing protein [Thermodesulfobacteriota bacterium]
MTEVHLPEYPEFGEVTPPMRQVLHPLFRALASEVSELTFANIYLFRETHNYMVSGLGPGAFVVSGADEPGREGFFMLPFGVPPLDVLGDLFGRFSFVKAAPEALAGEMAALGYVAEEDRDNFDYLYLREDLAGLGGKRFHKKKNKVNFFTGNYNCETLPLTDELVPDAISVLERWREARPGGSGPGDYVAAREALDRCYELQLCGFIYYVDGEPAGYTLGEEIRDDTFVTHFEKALGGYKGLAQFINQSFAAMLPERYVYVNREQDLGDEGLRHAKMGYRPASFVRKYRVRPGRTVSGGGGSLV